MEDKGREVSVFVSSVSVFVCVSSLSFTVEIPWFPDKKRDASAKRCRF